MTEWKRVNGQKWNFLISSTIKGSIVKDGKYWIGEVNGQIVAKNKRINSVKHIVEQPKLWPVNEEVGTITTVLE